MNYVLGIKEDPLLFPPPSKGGGKVGDDREHMFLAALAACESMQDRVGPKLLKLLPSAEAVWNAPAEILLRSDITPATIERFVHERTTIDPEKILKLCEQTGCYVVALSDPNYPTLLKEISFPPPVLFVRGTLPAACSPTLAVVGTRKMTSYGERIIRDLIPPLARAGVVIISGLAYGCDTLAHQTTVENNGVTLAVLGGGVDEATVYPTANRALARIIIDKGGAVLSAYPPGSEPKKHTFPQRNRLIAGLSRGTLVIEAPESSGALITARHALEENREVLSVPGSIYEENSKGTNELVARGARCVRTLEDILDALMLSELTSEQKSPAVRSDPREQTIINLLSREPQTPDAIIQQSGRPAPETLAVISQLELEGIIARLNDGKLKLRL